MGDFNCMLSGPSQGLSWDGPSIGLAAPSASQKRRERPCEEGLAERGVIDGKRFFRLCQALSEVVKNGGKSTMNKGGLQEENLVVQER